MLTKKLVGMSWHLLQIDNDEMQFTLFREVAFLRLAQTEIVCIKKDSKHHILNQGALFNQAQTRSNKRGPHSRKVKGVTQNIHKPEAQGAPSQRTCGLFPPIRGVSYPYVLGPFIYVLSYVCFYVLLRAFIWFYMIYEQNGKHVNGFRFITIPNHYHVVRNGCQTSLNS